MVAFSACIKQNKSKREKILQLPDAHRQFIAERSKHYTLTFTKVAKNESSDVGFD